jgi:hypothetical protein
MVFVAFKGYWFLEKVILCTFDRFKQDSQPKPAIFIFTSEL